MSARSNIYSRNDVKETAKLEQSLADYVFLVSHRVPWTVILKINADTFFGQLNKLVNEFHKSKRVRNSLIHSNMLERLERVNIL